MAHYKETSQIVTLTKFMKNTCRSFAVAVSVYCTLSSKSRQIGFSVSDKWSLQTKKEF